MGVGVWVGVGVNVGVWVGVSVWGVGVDVSVGVPYICLFRYYTLICDTGIMTVHRMCCVMSTFPSMLEASVGNSSRI